MATNITAMFTNADLINSRNEPLSPENAPVKALAELGFIVGASSNAMQAIQALYHTTFDHVQEFLEYDGTPSIRFHYLRGKHAIITDSEAIAFLQQYIRFFPEEDRSGRFFRYCHYGEDGLSIRGSKKVIGVNSLLKFRRRVTIPLD